MSNCAHLMTVGITCNGTGCDAAFTGPERPYTPGHENYEREAVACGWTVWIGRSRRHYCPHCAPARGHKMHLDTRLCSQQ